MDRKTVRLSQLRASHGAQIHLGHVREKITDPIARALHVVPRVQFLDEGTAHRGAATEAAVNAALAGPGITKVIVAHRPETIRMARRCVTLVDGRAADSRSAPAAAVDDGEQPTDRPRHDAGPRT